MSTLFKSSSQCLHGHFDTSTAITQIDAQQNPDDGSLDRSAKQDIRDGSCLYVLSISHPQVDLLFPANPLNPFRYLPLQRASSAAFYLEHTCQISLQTS